MIDELIKEKTIYVDGNTFIFTIRAITGKKVGCGRSFREFSIDFDIENEIELTTIAKTLNAILKDYQIIDKDEGVVDEYIQRDLNDFHTLMEIILNYKDNRSE